MTVPRWKSRPILLLTVLALSLTAVPALATPAPATPRPTRAPGATEEPGRSPEPARTTEPGSSPTVAASPGPGGVFPPVVGQRSLTIGYRQGGLRGRLPLLVAQARGYFQQAGFDVVELVDVEEPLAGVLGGELDLGVVTTLDAVNGISQGLPLSVVAGYHNYSDGGDTYGGDVLAASSDLVAADPGTITAFLGAYARALQDLSDRDSRDAILALAKASGIDVTDQVRQSYRDRVAEFAPFDGGFGSRENGGGLGELQAYLTDELGTVPDLSTVIAWPALLVAQGGQVLPVNPISDLLTPPGITQPRVGLPTGDEAARLPFTAAEELDAFSQAGFDGVDLVESDTALADLLAGNLEAAVIGVDELATAVGEGQPVVAIAGGQNAVEGDAPGTVLVTSADLVNADPSTLTHLLVAYIRGLRAVAGSDDPAAAAFAPYDGGFGPVDDAGGLGSLAARLGGTEDAASLIAWSPLVVAQTSLSLSANPTAAAIGPVPSWSAFALAAAPVPSAVPSPAS